MNHVKRMHVTEDNNPLKVIFSSRWSDTFFPEKQVPREELFLFCLPLFSFTKSFIYTVARVADLEECVFVLISYVINIVMFHLS